MASIPPLQRRQSPTQRQDSDQSTPQPAIQRSDSEAQSTISEDSQTVLLSPSSAKATITEQKEAETTKAPSQQPPSDELQPRRCWICFSDETDDTPTSSEWRSPCPCALTAHESCLLDWIADMEAPNSRQQKGPHDKILCPQCKAEIVLARPRSYVVDAVRGIEIFTSKLVLPGVLTIGASSFWYLCFAHGASSVILIFGPHDAEEILAPLRVPVPENDSFLEAVWNHLRTRWRLDIGLSLIPTMLIASRARIADGILPILPMLFFVTKPDSDPLLDLGSWPPSAGLSFALLPYVRSLYNTYYDRYWSEHEKRWLKEIQPRATSENQDANGEQRDNLDNEDNVLEINVDLGIMDEWDDEEAPPQVINPQVAHPLNAPPLDELGAAPEQAGIPAPAPIENANLNNANAHANAANANGQNGQNDLRNGNFNLAVSTYRLAESVLGALAFPAVSAIMGEFLRLTLPKSLTSRVVGPGGKPTGLLQAKWGRSIVGGCLFVVLKDAAMLYVRWRMAKDHRMRRVLDYGGTGGKGSRAKAGTSRVGLSSSGR